MIQQFKQQMNDYAAKLNFEQAEIARKKIESLQAYQVKSTIVTNRRLDADVYSLLADERWAYVNYLMVMNGTIVQTKTITLEKKLDESDEEILIFAISYLREKFQSQAQELVVPFHIDYPDKALEITVPKGGDKKKLLELSQMNADYFIAELKKRKILKLEGKSDMEKKKVLYQLQDDLQLAEAPNHIECFDNSNFQGSYPVAACVVFKEGIASKKDYRHFNIKTVKGINDFASMAEIVYRRYQRLLAEQQDLPQLVIIDGGKGQLNAAMESIEKLGLTGLMTVVGLAKNVEEIFFPGDQQSIKLPYDSESLKLIRRVRDEVHRFGISFHRQKRSKGTIKNELEDIPGIGNSTADQLLKTFRSVKKIKELRLEDISNEIGRHRAKLVWEWFHL